MILVLWFDIRISLDEAALFSYDHRRSHGFSDEREKYIIAAAVNTRTNSSCLQNPILSALALARKPVSALIDEMHLLAINASIQFDPSVITSACTPRSQVSMINNLDNRYRKHVDARSVRRACERWVAQTIFRSSGEFYLSRNGCHPRIRARYEKQRDDKIHREAISLFS